MLQNIANVLQILIAAGVAYFVAFWFALVIWTFRDIQSRSQDFVVQILATVIVAVMNIPGFLIYLILRPSDTLLEAYERSLEEESLLQDVENRLACPNCHQRVQADFLLCPACLTQLKRKCPHCSKVLQLKWNVCPFCANDVPASQDGWGQRGKTAAASASSSTQTTSRVTPPPIRERPIQPTLVKD